MKRGPMSNSDKLFVVQNKSKSLKFLSKKLNRTEESIKFFLDSLENQNEETPKKEIKPETQISAALSRNKKYGAVIMTPTASMISDGKKQKTVKKIKNNHIFIMNPREE